MIAERDVEHIAQLADIAISREELEEFTPQVNQILDYFDLLDQVEGTSGGEQELFNVFRDDTVEPSLPREDVIAIAPDSEDGFIKAPRVM
ncbi:aspartyl-tRNA(Asn)/glutamyl-tRNA(Gln) amidotransferase subunit C [Methanolinea mesophila]|uniref:Asp-tRNA(Asn)/Glu-tRNA(Gln) amidotransferase subunit GatC n=1 Tax=Methanolinea mesophila TaxID=547055 RepID=UPI001AE6267F|nr:Asp-tRNA(Asn)/Glu-tRNA(Gln) amidotransferase subunit GatC [Methanolinea mesophila]MBP1929773.1 aspartyl-tRNA(Asn)/glutamyl-tRNA(Gln) amidotransferase subunit C [Methanolinea mesophila]